VPANLRPLRNPAFRLFWSAGVISDIGTWVQLATVSTLLASSGASNTATALVYGALFIPQALCAPLGGVLADRLDRRVLFLRALTVQTLVTSVMAVAIARGERRPLVLGCMILIQGAAGSLGQPALAAVLPDLVPRDQLTAAVALTITSWNIGRVVGPVMAWALSWLGPASRVGVNAVSFAALWVAIYLMKRPFLPASKVRTTITGELRDGARNVVRARSCLFVILTVLVMHLTFIPFMGTIPIKAKAILGAKVSASKLSRSTGILMSAQGLGAVTGSLLIAQFLRRWRRSSIIRGAMLTAIATSIAYATSNRILFALPFMALVGGATAMLMGLFGGVVQRDAPAAHRGRVLSWMSGSNGLSYGIGLAMIGRLADRVGISRALFAGDVVLFTCVCLAMVAIPKWRTWFDGGDRPATAHLPMSGRPLGVTTIGAEVAPPAAAGNNVG
jgi:MFS family permease